MPSYSLIFPLYLLLLAIPNFAIAEDTKRDNTVINFLLGLGTAAANDEALPMDDNIGSSTEQPMNAAAVTMPGIQ